MKQCLTAALGGVLIASVATNGHTQPVDPALYGALPTVQEAAISPDGKSLALLQNSGDAKGVLFFNLDNLKEKPNGAGVGNAKPRDILWADNERVLLLASRAYDLSTNEGLQTTEMWRWLSIPKSGGKAIMLFGNDPGYFNPNAGELLGFLSGQDAKAVFARWTASTKATGSRGPSRLSGPTGWGYSLFAVDLKNGNEDQTFRGEPNTQAWIVGASGDAVARIDYDMQKGAREVYLRDGDSTRFNLASSMAEGKGDGAVASFHGMTSTPNHAFAMTTGPSGRLSLVEFDLATGAAKSTLFSNAAYDAGGVVYDYRKSTAIGVSYTDDLPRVHFLDEADRKLQASLAKALPGAAPIIASRSADGERMIVRAVYADHPDQYFFYDRAAKTMSMVASSYPKLDGKTAAQKEKFDYVAPDGTAIPGYLTTPKGASKSKMPLIVLPHGGPWARDDMAFDWWSFFYAARGYLVYQPNFRGSDGYGAGFQEAGYGEWGGKMQDDVTNGVKKLIADGVVDPERICIVGASYGGYAALAGATLTPDLYACAVSVNGVSNLPGLIGGEAKESEIGEAYWSQRIGSRFKNKEQLEAVSPVKNADKAVAPILLVHGKDDTVVPAGQSRQMRDALKASGKPHEYVELAGEDHWLSSGASRTAMLAKSIEFIDRHIGR